MDRDACSPPYDRAWLNYQYESDDATPVTRTSAFRETNDADAVERSHALPYRRHLPVHRMVRGFLENGDFLENDDHDREEVDEPFHAWFRSVTIRVSLRTRPSVPEDDR